MELLKELKRLKPNRKNYIIIPQIRLWVDKVDYAFSLFPTIFWQPWFCRYPETDGVIDIWWLNLHILIGRWERL